MTAAVDRSAERFERLLRIYRRRIARCRTENQVNRVHIALESSLTPAELRRFRAAFAGESPDYPGRLWIDSVIDLLPVGRARPREFERVGALRGMTLYSSGQGAPSGKTLIVGFAGNANRLMLHTALLLDCLDPDLYDLALLRDFSGTFYARGVPGLGTTFTETLSRLRARVDPAAYRNAIALGTSGGGIPALLAAIGLRLGRGIAIGAMSIEKLEESLARQGVDVGPMRALLAARPDPFPDLLLVYGTGYRIDAARAVSVARHVPARALAVKDCDTHGVLGWLLKRGELTAFLARALGQDLEGTPGGGTRAVGGPPVAARAGPLAGG